MKLSPEAYCKKHSLPELTKWIPLDDEVTTLSVRVAMHERLLGYADFLRQLVWPDGLTSTAEASVLSDHERSDALALYNRVMLLSKLCSLAELERSEASDEALVKKLAEEWPSLVKTLKPLIERTKSAYEGTLPGAGFVSYLG